jgi:hypothetical protein
MAIPTVTWNELIPLDSAERHEGEERIRELKTQMREILAVEHQMDYVYGTSQQDTDWGWHKSVTLICQPIALAAVADACILYSLLHAYTGFSTRSEWYCKDEDDNGVKLTEQGDWIGGMSGEIRMWHGYSSGIRTGWTLWSDIGTDVTNKFIRGIRTSVTEPGSMGGTNTKALLDSNIPTHTHTIPSSGAHTHAITISYSGATTYSGARMHTTTVATAHASLTSASTHTHSHTVATGSNGSFDKQPAYYGLGFIKKT